MDPTYAASTYKTLALNDTYISYTPSVGEANILVIPVWFTDSNNHIASSNKSKIREDIQKAYFGTNSDTGWRSVKTYYEEESHGALTLTGTVSSWYEPGERSSKYGNDDDYTSNTRSLVRKATDWYFNNNTSVSRKSFDKDGDGYLDGVMLIYAAPDYAAAKSSYDNFWAYCYWVHDTSVKSSTNPGANAFFWASFDFMYGSNKIYQKTGIAKSGYNGGGDTRNSNIDTHTFIHEMGHMYGLEDYYDYSGQYRPAGGFSMQDYNVGGHDPYSSFALGWGKAYIPNKTITLNIKPFATSGEMILLTPSFNRFKSPFDEYLLLEYYTPTGLNQFDTTYQYGGNNSGYPKGSQEVGIRVWHVDSRLFYYNDRYQTSFTLTTNPNCGRTVYGAMANTYYDSNGEGSNYLSPLGEGYYEYNQLQLIHNSTTANNFPTSLFSTNSLFRMGSSFNMNTYKKQFKNQGKLNSNIDLGFSFTVDNTVADYATVTVTKL